MYDERSWVRVGIIAAAVALVLFGWFVVLPNVTDGDDAPASVELEPDDLLPSSVAVSVDETTTIAADTTAAPDTPVAPDTTASPTTTAPPTTASPTTTAITTTTAAPTTTTAITVATTEGGAAGSGGAPSTYDTLPDGSPAPVVAVFETDRITLSGAVPSEAARERLETLAIANAKPGQADTIENEAVVIPDVPIGVGVRVVETTSTRFPESSSEVLPPHAAELDRAVGIMNALPNVTALVVGHADQRGDAGRNFQLSAQRAEAVVNYMVANGIAPSRLASRSVGESDLLTLDSDDISLALNRRTEFVFYGLLVE